jgi:glutathione peroxidase
MASIYDFEVSSISGKKVGLADYQGKVLLIVNTASKCGFTPQFTGLEKLYEELHAQGLEILGFPCNQFLKQDPGSDSEISEFCSLNYGVTFPMFSKIEVNGDNTHPLYRYLKSEAKGLLGSENIKWNFTKFLVNREGKVVKRYAPNTEPKDIEKDIKALL